MPMQSRRPRRRQLQAAAAQSGPPTTSPAVCATAMPKRCTPLLARVDIGSRLGIGQLYCTTAPGDRAGNRAPQNTRRRPVRLDDERARAAVLWPGTDWLSESTGRDREPAHVLGTMRKLRRSSFAGPWGAFALARLLALESRHFCCDFPQPPRGVVKLAESLLHAAGDLPQAGHFRAAHGRLLRCDVWCKRTGCISAFGCSGHCRR